MPQTTLEYSLNDGFIHNWLVAGPHIVAGLEVTPPELSSPDFNPSEKLETLTQQIFEDRSGVVLPVIDLGFTRNSEKKDYSLRWGYRRCLEDHLVNLDGFYKDPVILSSWAYAEIELNMPQDLTIQASSQGFIHVWLDDNLVLVKKTVQPSRMTTQEEIVKFHTGSNRILIRFDQLGLSYTGNSLALKISGFSGQNARILLPTDIEHEKKQLRIDIERAIYSTWTEKYVFGNLGGIRYERNEPIDLHFSPDLSEKIKFTIRLQSLDGNIFQETTDDYEAGDVLSLASIFPLRSGPHDLAMLPDAGDYYLKGVRFERKERFYIVSTGFTVQKESTYRDRVMMALEDASKRRIDSIFSEIAFMAMGQWQKVHWDMVQKSFDRIEQNKINAIEDVFGLLMWMSRFWRKTRIPKEITVQGRNLVRQFPYRSEYDNACTLLTTSQLLYLTCELLAGQFYPSDVFQASQEKGEWHRKNAEAQLLSIMAEQSQKGSDTWHSPNVIASDLASLACLVDLAQSDDIRELAMILIDKAMFFLAVYSFKGMFIGPAAIIDSASILSHRLCPTSGINRLFFGRGNFNDHFIATVSLSCCKKYKLPALIRQIADDRMDVFWGKDRQRSSNQSKLRPGQTPDEANSVIYRCSDFALTSVQDFAPGKPGTSEHLWSATLGPDAVVFVNHPGNMSEEEASMPNLWRGNTTLPRLVQWGDLLVGLYKIPEEDWMGYTHAYFPVRNFDEYSFVENWAFARVGKGYLGLMSSSGFRFIQSGRTAYRELRAIERDNVWICQMGLALLDGKFEDFKAKVLNQKLKVENLSVNLESIRGEIIHVGWDQPLIVNEQEQTLNNFDHVDNVYCRTAYPAEKMDIIYNGKGLRLKLG